MIRYWVSWWSGYYADEGCTKPPFQVWVSGTRPRLNDEKRDDCSICAVIDAESASEVETIVAHHFPDYEMRFIEFKDADWQPPADRFPKKS